tara:strand:+ start:242 stop:469 length:228 start_codon:yes stop_codon:yes gene_type:complete
MKTVVKPNLKSKTFFVSKSYTRLRKKEIGLINFKFYQKLLVVLISLSTFLILPESPRELANICESYNSRKLCIVW